MEGVVEKNKNSHVVVAYHDNDQDTISDDWAADMMHEQYMNHMIAMEEEMQNETKK